MINEKIWYEDLKGSFSPSNYFIVIPSKDMTLEEKINSIVRFFIYFGIILALVCSNYKYLFFGIIACLLSLVIYQYEKTVKEEKAKFMDDKNLTIVNNDLCTKSTVDNPFMNSSIIDYADNPNRPKACDVDNEGIKKVVESNFNKNLFKNVSDLYGKMSSQRQYYTMPSTTIPNDRDSFMKWRFSPMVESQSCKEGDGLQCYRNLGFQNKTLN